MAGTGRRPAIRRLRERWRRQAAPAALAACAASLLAAGILAPVRAHADSGTPDTSAKDDMYVLRCLAPDQRARTADAAVRLGLARPVAGHPDRLSVAGTDPGGGATTLTVQRWAAARPADFRRACAALVATDAAAPHAADASGGGGLGDTLSGALLAVVGALFTLLIQFIDRGTTRRRQRIDELAAATVAYARGAGTFLDRWIADPSAGHEDIRAARTELAAALALLPGRTARRARAARLAEELPLAEAPESTEPSGLSGVRKLSRAERGEKAAALRVPLHQVLFEIEELGRAGLLLRARRTARGAVSGPGGGSGAGGGER